MQGATISLDGLWEFRRDDETTWQRIVVPGSWEHVVPDVTWSGVGWYRQRVHVPFAFAECGVVGFCGSELSLPRLCRRRRSHQSYWDVG